MLLFDLSVVLGLVLLNGFFAMAEMAIVSARPGLLKQMAAEGSRGARTALELTQDPGRFLSTVQVGITLVGVLAGVFSGATLADPLALLLISFGMETELAEATALGTVVVGISYATLIAGELVPKRIALSDAEGIAARVAPVMRGVALVGAPIVFVLRGSTDIVLRVLRVRPRTESAVSEEEVKALVAEGAASGVFHAAERQMIEGVMRIADRSVRAVMTPRKDVVWLKLGDPPEVLRARIAKSGHSRFPVSRDGIDDVVGVVQTKDILNLVLKGRRPDLKSVLRKPLVVPESSSVIQLLEQFRSAPCHLAVVVDEYGAFMGIATPADILGGIAGDFPDDSEIEMPQAVQRADGSWLIDGMMGIDKVEQVLGTRGLGGAEDYHTLAGFMLWKLGRIPAAADTVVFRSFVFEVMDMDGRRVDKVLIRPAGREG